MPERCSSSTSSCGEDSSPKCTFLSSSCGCSSCCRSGSRELRKCCASTTTSSGSSRPSSGQLCVAGEAWSCPPSDCSSCLWAPCRAALLFSTRACQGRIWGSFACVAAPRLASRECQRASSCFSVWVSVSRPVCAWPAPLCPSRFSWAASGGFASAFA